jgi:dolichol-phosphate mannosyltransferase
VTRLNKKNTIHSYISVNLINTRIIKFALVGLSGILVNMGFLYLLSELLHIYYLIASIIAIEISIISNFFLNDLWTWSDRKKKKLFNRLYQYHISVGLTAIFVNWLLLFILTEVFGIYYLISNLIGIGCGTLFNYILNDVWTFKKL